MSGFSSHDNDPIDVPSTWKETRSFDNTNIQTDPVKTSEDGIQSIEMITKETQTNTPQVPTKSPNLSEEEEKSLANFLSKVSKNIIKELDKSDMSNTMARFAMLDFEDSNGDIKYEKLKNYEAPQILEENTKIKVSSMSWNCAGSLLAVAFCCHDHSTWCAHSGSIHFYNKEKATPSHVIKTKSCVTSVSMHPYELSLVAAGTYAGEVCTYNKNLEDSDCLLNYSTSHSSPVSQISWEYISSTINRPVLVSSSLDGTMTLYNVVHQTSTMTLVKKYSMSDPQLSVRPGILCYTFSSLLLGTFITAVEGGHIYSCSTIVAAPELSGEATQEQHFNPIVNTFEKHPSNVNAISFSKHSVSKETLFISSSLEEIRIYNINNTSPTHIINNEKYCLGITWSISQPQIFLYWGSDGLVTIYNALKRQEIASFNTSNNMITSVSYNSKIPNLIAMGNDLGETQIWQIPKYFKI